MRNEIQRVNVQSRVEQSRVRTSSQGQAGERERDNRYMMSTGWRCIRRWSNERTIHMLEGYRSHRVLSNTFRRRNIVHNEDYVIEMESMQWISIPSDLLELVFRVRAGCGVGLPRRDAIIRFRVRLIGGFGLENGITIRCPREHGEGWIAHDRQVAGGCFAIILTSRGRLLNMGSFRRRGPEDVPFSGVEFLLLRQQTHSRVVDSLPPALLPKADKRGPRLDHRSINRVTRP